MRQLFLCQLPNPAPDLNYTCGVDPEGSSCSRPFVKQGVMHTHNSSQTLPSAEQNSVFMGTEPGQ